MKKVGVPFTPLCIPLTKSARTRSWNASAEVAAYLLRVGACIVGMGRRASVA